MKQWVAALIVSVLLIKGACAVPGIRSVPPASFLDYHVDTAADLTFEVAYDPAVRARLARHFHLTGPAMSAYVARNLVLAHLKAPLTTRVYCVAPSHREYYVLMTLKKGQAVFALRGSGKPILRLECGNPLVPVLPKPQMMASNVLSPAKTVVRSMIDQQITPGISAPQVLAASSGAGLAAPVIDTVGSGEIVFTGASSGGSLLGWVSLAGGVFAGLASQSPPPSGTVFSPPTAPAAPSLPLTPNGTPPAGPPAAPEPSPAFVLVLGGLCLAAWRFQRISRDA